jgi:site-specific recombinase XerD
MSAISDYLANRADLAAGSRKIHAGWLAGFDLHCRAVDLAWTSCQAADLEGFHQKLLWQCNRFGGLNSPNTVDQALRVLRQFYRWAHQKGVIVADPTAGWRLGRPLQREQPVLARDQVLALLNLPDLSQPEGLRDQLLLELLFHLELSLSTCRLLELSSPGLEAVAPTLERYLSDGRPRFAQDATAPLLLTNRGHAYRSERGLALILRHYAQKLGLSHALTPRVLHRSHQHQIESISLRRFSPGPKNGSLGR